MRAAARGVGAGHARADGRAVRDVAGTVALREARLRDASAYEAKLLDAVNLRVLEELTADGRIPMAELGRRVGLSAPAVAERVQRLERAGVIAGDRAELDPRALGYPVSAVVLGALTNRPTARVAIYLESRADRTRPG